MAKRQRGDAGAAAAHTWSVLIIQRNGPRLYFPGFHKYLSILYKQKNALHIGMSVEVMVLTNSPEVIALLWQVRGTMITRQDERVSISALCATGDIPAGTYLPECTWPGLILWKREPSEWHSTLRGQRPREEWWRHQPIGSGSAAHRGTRMQLQYQTQG